ncbi:MAG TPA: hypothetical protein VGA70_08995 [Longimicrobiales bacterium]|jgi:predicted  nucleic acid-binding Zn-ribbon protein
MSADSADREALDALEAAVTRALSRVAELEEALASAVSRSREMEGLLSAFSADEEAPQRMVARVRRLEAENGHMRERMGLGRESVERLLAKIRFLEEQR